MLTEWKKKKANQGLPMKEGGWGGDKDSKDPLGKISIVGYWATDPSDHQNTHSHTHTHMTHLYTI